MFGGMHDHGGFGGMNGMGGIDPSVLFNMMNGGGGFSFGGGGPGGGGAPRGRPGGHGFSSSGFPF